MGLSSMPTVTVEIGFNASPTTAESSITWTNVSAYVDNIDITRGRVDETRPFEPSNATVHLLNHDRRFDPSNTSGPYYGNLLPRRPIRIKATWSATTYPVFRGWVSGFPVEFTNAGKESYVTLQCFDALGLLGVFQTADNYYDTYLDSLNPTGLWKMNDSMGTDTILDTIEPTFHLLTYQKGEEESKMVAPSIIPQVLTNSLTNLGENGLQTQTFGYTNKSTSYYCAFWVQTLWRTGGTDQTIQFKPNVDEILIHITNRIKIEMYISPLSTYYNIAQSSVKINDGRPHFIVVSVADSKEPVIYVDGERQTRLLADASYYTTYWATLSTALIRSGLFTLNISATSQYVTALQYLATFVSLSETQIQTLYRYGIGYYRQLAADRFYGIGTTFSLDQIPINFSNTDADNEVGYLNWNARNLLDLFQEVARSDNGNVFVDPEGTLQFYDRDLSIGWGAIHGTTATFSASDIKFRGDLQIDLSAEQVRNSVVVEDSFGQQIQAIDTTSYATYGESSEVLSTIVADEIEASDVATRRVKLFKDAKLAISEFIVDPQVDTTKWSQMLSLDLLDQISLTITPSTGSAISAVMLVQQLRHEITPARWAIGIVGSKRMTGYFITNTSRVNGTDVVL